MTSFEGPENQGQEALSQATERAPERAQEQAQGQAPAQTQPTDGRERPEQGNGRRRRFDRFKPLKVGEELDVKIEKTGEKGDGIVTVKGLVLFVPGGEVGLECRVKVVRILRNFAVGEIIA